MKELTLEAKIENIECATEFVNAQLEALGCSVRTRRLIEIAIDELFSNIAYYAYGEKTGMATIRVKKKQEPQGAIISFIDSGRPFNPLMQKDPSLKLTVKECKAGGFGISIVKRSMDDVCYEYVQGCNVTKITKTFQ